MSILNWALISVIGNTCCPGQNCRFGGKKLFTVGCLKKVTEYAHLFLMHVITMLCALPKILDSGEKKDTKRDENF